MFSPTELQEVELFLGMLFPWDDEGEQLYKCVSWTFINKEGESQFANYAARKPDDLVRLISSRARRAGANVYVGLGTQKMALIETVTNDGFPKAQRQKANIVSWNCIALDIDVDKNGAKPGAYATTEDARAALADFVKTSGLPEPTMQVLSGSGGLHVYWCFTKPAPVKEWALLAGALQAAGLAYGLKFDPAVTVNPTLILRVPNTWNHKSAPPNKVRLIREPGHLFPRYDFEQMAAALAQWTGAHAVADNVKQGPGANRQRTQNFTENVEGAPPVTIDELVVNCMTLDDMLERGGKGDAEPLWNLGLYAASFTSDPHDAAHRLSGGDPRYSHADTEKKLAEKVAARTGNAAAGWPRCSQFAALSPKCALCPLKKQDKTPFHHVIRYEGDPEKSDHYVHQADDTLMPVNFWRNKLGHVLTTQYNKSGLPQTVEAFPYPLLDGGLDPKTGELLYLVSIAGVDQWRTLDVSVCMQPGDAARHLAKGYGVVVPQRNHGAARDFLLAWVKHLQTMRRVASQSGYGWQGTAFAYDDKIYYADRTETVYRGKNHDPYFTVRGELKPWQDAMQLVYGNTPLETVVASAFAAPLVELVGSSSLVLSVYSQLSGVGKSTAMMLAQAVWGDPRSGMSTLNDTANSMMKKISDLKSLPVYWDELRTKDQLEKVIDIVFQVTQGKGKARLNKDITQAEAPAFTTMFIVASNHGISDTVYSQTESTEAGGLRLFEIEPQALQTTLRSNVANKIILPLQDNFGAAGARYAEWLAQNRKSVMQMLDMAGDQLIKRHDLKPKERFWTMTMTTLLVGAGLANHIGLTSFDMPALGQYLDDMLATQRGEMQQQEYATMQATQDVVGLLQEMISDQRNKGLIVTETIPYAQMGRPVPLNLVDTDLSRLGDVWLQVGDQDGRVRARLRTFKDWLRKRGLNPNQIIRALGTKYKITQTKQTIGRGVAGLDATTRIGQQQCIDLTPLPSAHAPSPDSYEQTPGPG